MHAMYAKFATNENRHVIALVYWFTCIMIFHDSFPLSNN